MKKAANAIISSQLSSISNSFPIGQSDPSTQNIKWEEYNWPPLVHIIHFSLKELSEPHRSTVKTIYVSFLLFFIVSLIDLLNSFIEVGIGVKGTQILYSFLNIIIVWPIATTVFYRGYKGITYDDSLLFLYKVFQGLLMIFYFIISIVGFPFNGWVRMAQLFKSTNNGSGFCGFLALLESLINTANVFLCGYLIFIIHTERWKNPNIKPTQQITQQAVI